MKGGLDWVGRGVLTYYRLFVCCGRCWCWCWCGEAVLFLVSCSVLGTGALMALLGHHGLFWKEWKFGPEQKSLTQYVQFAYIPSRWLQHGNIGAEMFLKEPIYSDIFRRI